MSVTDIFWLYVYWRLIEAAIGLAFVAIVSVIYAVVLWKTKRR